MGSYTTECNLYIKATSAPAIKNNLFGAPIINFFGFFQPLQVLEEVSEPQPLLVAQPQPSNLPAVSEPPREVLEVHQRHLVVCLATQLQLPIRGIVLEAPPLAPLAALLELRKPQEPQVVLVVSAINNRLSAINNRLMEQP